MTQVKIPLDAFKEVACKACGSQALIQLLTLRIYPGGLFSPVPVPLATPLFRCADCGANIELPTNGSPGGNDSEYPSQFHEDYLKKNNHATD